MVEQEELEALEGRLQLLENEVAEIRAALNNYSETADRDRTQVKNSTDEFQKLQRGLQEISETTLSFHKIVGQIEKRVDEIRRQSTSGLVISVVVFSILVVISLVVRSQ
ncbi:MAG: hypothetical protein HQL57_08610 [Magnetococcales bacterium]|nr:hypothetical protein [Magnetococcales bacterium]MBF0157229.1 hypothetical protein [Magnetococcales bacterium]